jgi:hydroxypyruvate reductase
MAEQPAVLLRRMFDAAVAAVAPALCLPRALPAPPPGRTLVVGAGKAAAAMAQTVERNWPGDLSGLVVTRYGHGLPTQHIEVIEAAHPVPDPAGLAAAARVLDLAAGLGPDDLMLCLLSGGGSALLTLPAAGLDLADKQAVTTALLRSGANIAEINCVRKHLSAIKGGRLAAAAAPAETVALMISDVVGDDPAVIASGPTVADPTTFADALAVLDRYRIGEPASVLDHLRAAIDESPKPDDPRLARSQARIVARPRDALTAAAEVARAAGVEAVLLGDDLEGEARERGRDHARLAVAERRRNPVVLLSGGELTVTIAGKGRGGPNTEYLLALAEALDGASGIHAIACDSDGIDGSEDNAGALIDPGTLTRAASQGLDPAHSLADNDAYGFFAALNDLVMTGPTRTNVNDFRAVLVLPES